MLKIFFVNLYISFILIFVFLWGVMKSGRCFSVLLIVCLTVLFFYSDYSLLGVVNFTSVDYEIIDFDTSNFTISMSVDEWNVLSNDIVVEEVSRSVICDRDVVEYYSPMIKNYVVVGGRKVNLQVSIFDGECVVGCPLIEKSFWWCIKIFWLVYDWCNERRFLWKIKHLRKR